MRHLYIHLPYCSRKCIYCDFYSEGARRADWSALRRGLLRELACASRDGFLTSGEYARPCETLYLGGGTPSLMPAEELGALLTLPGVSFAPGAERTIEVNPDDVTHERFDAWRKLGFNRFSMGVQSFSDAELRLIGRRHTAAQAREACAVLARSGNLSIDLIFGLPGQTRRQWCESVAEAIALRPQHISAYALMVEDGTPLSVMLRQKRLSLIPEEESEAMYLYLVAALRSAGYEHYEISNFALPGFRSRHNSSYWSGEPYLGLGPAAHSYDGLRRRRANLPDLRAYNAVFASGERGGNEVGNTCPGENAFDCAAAASVREEEYLGEEELRDEFIMCRMRTREGIHLPAFRDRFGEESLRRLLKAVRPAAADGLLQLSGESVSLTEKSLLRSDPVILELTM